MEKDSTPIKLSKKSAGGTDSWEIGHLLNAALDRTADRFFSYFGTIIVAWLLFAALILFLVLGGLLVFTFYKLASLTAVAAILAVFLIAAFFVGFVYIASWTSLAQISIIISDTKTGVMENYKNLKPRVWDYVGVNLLMGLFMIGILPWGLLSLTIVFILWAFWSTFVPFVFLEQKMQGLDNLWFSRQLVSQKFWLIGGRIFLVQIIFFLINIALAATKEPMVGIASFFISIFAAPFFVSFIYLMYKKLEVPEKVEAPRVWITLSIIGWIIMIALFALLIVGSIFSSGRMI